MLTQSLDNGQNRRLSYNETTSKWKLQRLWQSDSLILLSALHAAEFEGGQSHLSRRREPFFSTSQTGRALHISNTLQCEMKAPKLRAHAHSQSKVITATSSILFLHWRRICQSQRESSDSLAMQALMGWFIGSEQWLPVWLVISHVIGSCSPSLLGFFGAMMRDRLLDKAGPSLSALCYDGWNTLFCKADLWPPQVRGAWWQRTYIQTVTQPHCSAIVWYHTKNSK